jgi:hypothetical protein
MGKCGCGDGDHRKNGDDPPFGRTVPPSGSNPNRPSIHVGQRAVTIVAVPRRAERTISIRALSTTDTSFD